MTYFGLGTAIKNNKGEWLEAKFPLPTVLTNENDQKKLAKIVQVSDKPVFFSNNDPLASKLRDTLSASDNIRLKTSGFMIQNDYRLAQSHLFVYMMEKDRPLQSVIQAYFKLQLISHRLAQPNELDLNNIFKILPNIAWSNIGPIDLEELPAIQWKMSNERKPFIVYSVDKFPRLTDYLVPKGVRIADTSRVRLGAYLGTGTTIMHEGFVNFNAGCEGPNMIEGRVSAGVWVKKNSDIGGGASIMGTLSGGGNQKITIGENCLIGANAGLGIPLGDRCVVEAGLYLTSGLKVSVVSKNKSSNPVVYARQLSNQSDLTFRRNSQTGVVECLPGGKTFPLNDVLHSNQ